MPQGRRLQFRVLVDIPVPKGHRPLPAALITTLDRQLGKAYLACKGDVASVCRAFGVDGERVRNALVKLGVWKRWAPAGKQTPPCELCGKPVKNYHHTAHGACREKLRAASRAKLDERVKKLTASGLTLVQVAKKLGYSRSHITQAFSGLSLTAAQRRRRGLPPAIPVPPSAGSTTKRPYEIRKPREWFLVTVAPPPSLAGKPAQRLTPAERSMVRGYLTCNGDVESVGRAHGVSASKVRDVLPKAQVWQRWSSRPGPDPACASCGKPMRHRSHSERHAACRLKEQAATKAAWMARARKLLARGWTLARVGEHLGLGLNTVSVNLPGHARAQKDITAAADAKLRKFAKLVEQGLSTKEAARRARFESHQLDHALQRARQKGYL